MGEHPDLIISTINREPISLNADSFGPSVLETFLPLGALLAGSGFGKLIKRYAYVRSDPDQSSKDPKGRPRVQVTGPKVQPETCQICMGKIKEGTEYVRCTSGRIFHSICLARVGQCPYCRRTFAIKGRESTTTREYVQPIVPDALAPEAEEGVERLEPLNPCPACGRELEEEATGCECGVIFVTEGGKFPCPACKFQVTEGDAFCGRCGERFLQHTPPGCPVCGRAVMVDAETCACGAILGNHCPECGAELAEGASSCQVCGTAFEFV
jgi:hypothetical protein